MKTQDSRINLMQEIDNMYVVNVSFGKYTRPGSFIAYSEEGGEFFADIELVKKKLELFELLSNRVKPLLVLVKDEIWGGKWGDKRVSEIVEISENKKGCEDYKAKLIQQLQFKFELSDLHERYIKLIENLYMKPSFVEKEQKLQREISVLEEKLSILNNLIDS